MTRRRIMLSLAGIFFVGVVSAFYVFWPRPNHSSDQVLAQLLTDPLSARIRPGATLVVAQDDASSRGIVFSSKPTTTRVLRAFTPTTGSPQELLARIRSEAVTSGWAMTDLTPTSVGTRGTKTFGFGAARVTATVNTIVSPAQVVIDLQPVDPNR